MYLNHPSKSPSTQPVPTNCFPRPIRKNLVNQHSLSIENALNFGNGCIENFAEIQGPPNLGGHFREEFGPLILKLQPRKEATSITLRQLYCDKIRV